MASKIALLDVNILIALFDIKHQHHDLVSRWFIKWRDDGNGWASCPMTQNGCIRVLSLPNYPNSLALQEIKQKLTRAVQDPSHTFIHDNISLLQDDLINWRHIQGSRQLTDTYLLALAKHNQAVFVSLDGRIEMSTVIGACDEHFIIVD